MESLIDFIIGVLGNVWRKFINNAVPVLCLGFAAALFFFPLTMNVIVFGSVIFIISAVLLTITLFFLIETCILCIKNVVIDKDTVKAFFSNIKNPLIAYLIFAIFIVLMFLIGFAPVISERFAPSAGKTFVYYVLMTLPIISAMLIFLFSPYFLMGLFYAADGKSIKEAKSAGIKLAGSNKKYMYFLQATLLFLSVFLNLIPFLGAIIFIPLFFLAMAQAYAALSESSYAQAAQTEIEEPAATRAGKRMRQADIHEQPQETVSEVHSASATVQEQKKEPLLQKKTETKREKSKPQFSDKDKRIKISEVCKIITVKLLPVAAISQIKLLRERVADNEIKEIKRAKAVFGKAFEQAKEEAVNPKPRPEKKEEEKKMPSGFGKAFEKGHDDEAKKAAEDEARRIEEERKKAAAQKQRDAAIAEAEERAKAIKHTEVKDEPKVSGGSGFGKAFRVNALSAENKDALKEESKREQSVIREEPAVSAPVYKQETKTGENINDSAKQFSQPKAAPQPEPRQAAVIKKEPVIPPQEKPAGNKNGFSMAFQTKPPQQSNGAPQSADVRKSAQIENQPEIPQSKTNGFGKALYQNAAQQEVSVKKYTMVEKTAEDKPAEQTPQDQPYKEPAAQKETVVSADEKRAGDFPAKDAGIIAETEMKSPRNMQSDVIREDAEVAHETEKPDEARQSKEEIAKSYIEDFGTLKRKPPK